MGGGVAPDGDMVDVGQLEAGIIETEADRLDRKAGPMLYAADPLFFDGSNQPAVGHQAGGRVAVVGVDAEDVHVLSLCSGPAS